MWRTLGRRRKYSWVRLQRLLWMRHDVFTSLVLFLMLLQTMLPIAIAQHTPSTRTTKPAQEFAIEPSDRTAIAGKAAVLPCRVLHKVGTLQWTRDGFGLGSDRELKGFSRYTMSGSDDEGDYSLHISKVSLDDDAMFQCQVGAADGVKGIRSRNAAFTVYVPPEHPRIVQGDNLKTTAGMTVELTCESHSGKPPAELSWLDGEGNVVSDGVEYTTQLLADGKRANAALKWTLTPKREHDGREFTCKSENPALNKPLKAAIKLEVKYPPEITLKVSAEKIVEIDEVRFLCNAVANPTDVVYKWYKNDDLIKGDHTTSYVISKVSKDYNKQTISCEVSNSVGTTKSTHTLNVLYGPVFKSEKKIIAADVGSDVELSCDVEGNPTPDTVWTYEGSNAVLSTESRLRIPQLTPEKAGKYTCRATVLGFPEITMDMHVYIKGPPEVRGPPIQYGVEGEIVKLECVIRSVPPPIRVFWYRNSEHVEVDNNKGYEISEEPMPDGVKYILVIHRAEEEDFGQYNCSVWNELGSHSRPIILRKQKSYPMLIILAGVIGGIVFIVSITIVIILCLRRKSVIKDEDYGSEKKTKQSDSASSGDSDLKVEIRTASSLSNNEHERSWEDNSDNTLRAHDHLYNKYAHQNDYSDGSFPPKPEPQSNNGYIPYVDYTRDYTPPAVAPTSNGVRDSGVYNSPPQSLSDLGQAIDPRYRAGYANPYLRTSQSTLPPPQGVFVTSTWGGHPSNPSSPAAVQQQNPGQPRYITAQQSQTHVKPGTLATHV